MVAQGFVFPFEAGHTNEIHDHISEADEDAFLELDREAQARAARALLEVDLPQQPKVMDLCGAHIPRIATLARNLDSLAVRSSEPFMEAVVGHLPYTIVQRLVTLVFFPDGCSSDKADSAGYVEHLLFLLSMKQPLPANDDFPSLRTCLMNSDAIHQSLLRTTKEAVKEFSSPHARTAETLPAFPVFSGTGEAQDAFRRRPLDAHEAMHPYLPETVEGAVPSREHRRSWRKSPAPNPRFAAETNVPPGECSVVPTLAMFQRAFRVFTLGLVENAGLARDRAVVAGGAVAACLHPWPPHIRRLWLLEQRSLRLLRSGFRGRLPPEIAAAVDRLAGWSESRTVALDRALFEHLCRSRSPYGSSDIDVFFVCPEGAADVSAARRALPEVHAAVVRNRQAVDLRRFLDKKEHAGHWAFQDLGRNYDWFAEALKGRFRGRFHYRSYSEMRREREIAPTHELDLQGWSQRMLDGLRGRMRLLWTVRTTNSVTVTGIHPVRHTQLMLPVVRAPEQVVHTFDLDSVCVFYDGLQVYATARSLRAFNTRTNFVDLRSVQDRARAHRMIKYRDRGFATAVFDICRHDPRCDVRATARVRASIRRSFPEYVLQCGSPPHLKTDAFPVPLDPDDDRGLDPPISKLQEVGFDYRPAPLVYEEWIGASELREQIELLESGRYEIEEDDIRTFAPVLKKLPYAITQDPIKFADCLMVAERNLIAMQFKFVKDDWLDRRLWIASALHFCHMCGKDVSAADGSTSALKSPKDSELDDDNMDDVESNDGKSDNDELDDDESGLDDRSMAEPSWDSASTGSLNSGSEPESSSADEPANRRPSRNQPPKPSCAATCCQCANLNAEMRTKTVDLRGTVALVTATGEPGALARRVVLRLLRMGATVHVAARLPHLLLAELRKEVNADLWWDRVWVHKVDMADLASVVEIAEVWAATMARLDVVVHIAAMRNVLREGSGEAWERRARDDALLGASMDEETLRPWMRAQRQDATAAGLAAADIATLLAPLGLDNQLLRSISVMAATGVPPAAAAGVDAADVSGTAAAAGILAPAVLLQKLRPLLAASTAKAHPSVRVRASFVVHVLPLGGSMEPAMPQPADRDCMAKNFNSSCSSSSSSSTQALHVEMAEAAIARLTLTVAGPLAAADGIYLTAVDPGWVSTGTAPEAVAALALADKSKPRRGASRMGELLPPLEIEDGAARVLDPVVRGLSEGVLLKGVLLRNFKQSSW